MNNVCAGGLTFALIALFCLGNTLRAAESDSSSNSTRVPLEYQETSYSVINWGINLTGRSTPFKKEPAAVTGKIIRGVLNFGPKSGEAVPFLWQRDARKLYLDLNRNEDLTDDPTGVFSAGEGPVNYATFTNAHLVFNTVAGKSRVLADINFWDFGATANCNFSVRSFWQGKLTLEGHDWQAGIIENGTDESSPFVSSQLLLRPWAKRSQPFSAYNGSLASVPFSPKLFFDGRAWGLTCAAHSQNGEARPTLQFTEQTVPLGELKITGQFIRRLVLTGAPYLVILDQPGSVVKIPTGKYHLGDVDLEGKGSTAFHNSLQSQGGRQLSVSDKPAAAIDVGGPLTNSVAASRHGRDLRLDYSLIGAGGETYQMANQDRSKPPTFAVYKNGKKLTSGTFEFG